MTALNAYPVADGQYVLYWMQQAQRTHDNPALALAISEANRHSLPLVVCFGLDINYPHANARHMRFMLQSLPSVAEELRQAGAAVCIQLANPLMLAQRLAQKAALVVVDQGYLRHQRAWRQQLADSLQAAVWQVNTETLVDVELAAPKQQWSAATIRPKLWSKMPSALRTVPMQSISVKLLYWDDYCEPLDDIEQICSQYEQCEPTLRHCLDGGCARAVEHLNRFIEDHLEHYQLQRNDPSLDAQSQMSPYLHFGQISSRDIIERLLASGIQGEGLDAYIEQLFIRRELAINYVLYQPHYDSWDGLPPWSKSTLLEHAADEREYVYTYDQLVSAQTHDVYWNAAMKELRYTGKMHGYMRMYWVKQMIAWCASPKLAYQWAVEMNDRYSLDGRDANGYAGIGWCFGLHDRPWFRRPVFGTVRPMTAKGLASKFNMAEYIRRVDQLCG